MTDFLYLMRGGEAHMKSLSEAEQQAHMDEWKGYMGGLAQSGHLKGGAPLNQGGKVIAGENKRQSDGAYAAGGPVGGYIIVSANDLGHAVELTNGCPIFGTGGEVEVREILEM